MPVMTASDLIAFLARVVPHFLPDRYRIETVEDGRLVFRYQATQEDLRPGDTVSGPTLMSLSDLGMYFTVLSAIGPVALAVTTNLNINFLRKPPAGELVVETLLLKLGRQLAVGEVFVRSGDAPEVISHATVTYSIPPASTAA
jgi:acyl-coenzyme A thioesterase PaaI-like protein